MYVPDSDGTPRQGSGRRILKSREKHLLGLQGSWQQIIGIRNGPGMCVWFRQRPELHNLEAQKLTGKAEAILKELLVDEGEDPQVAKETKEIGEAEIYDSIKADMDRLLENKQKELRQHIQGILRENAMAH